MCYGSNTIIAYRYSAHPDISRFSTKPQNVSTNAANSQPPIFRCSSQSSEVSAIMHLI